MNGVANYAMMIFVLAAALFYVYFANVAVRAVTLLEKTKGQMQSLSMQVSEMESERLSIENNIDTQKASQLGLVEVNNPIFIMRNSQKTALSFNSK